MDGNGRWAKARGLHRGDGHKEGARAVKKIVEVCRKRGVRYLTLFSFSSENWGRDETEVSQLMKLFETYLNSELDSLLENKIRLRAIGDLKRLPDSLQGALKKDMDLSEQNKEMELILAISYGARDEIVSATKSLCRRVQAGELEVSDIDEQVFADSLWSAGVPDPDLLIRSSGEMRLSNFLLWQLAYTEIVVSDVFWPDFNEQVLDSCVEQFKSRARRFGLTDEQLSEGSGEREGEQNASSVSACGEKEEKSSSQCVDSLAVNSLSGSFG